MKQLTKKQAIAFAETGAWEALALSERGYFQLRQKFLCMPFDKFHEAVTVTLGRPVWTHEFADSKRLIAEAEGRTPKPTFAEIVGRLPAEKVVLIGLEPVQ